MSRIEVSVLRWVPPYAQGLVRDLRVRWALEEAGLSYGERVIGPEDQANPHYRAIQPFGQVPAYMDDDVILFESGAIVLWIAESSQTLLPTDATGRARVHAWMFAALSSVEPVLQNLADLDLFVDAGPWAKERRPTLLKRANSRLLDLARVLESRDYLEGQFTAGDLMMASVLRIPRHLPVVGNIPTLAAYLARCESRPAFQRALASQLAVFQRNEPKVQ